MNNDKILELHNIISKSQNIVFFGGAGVSTESGIPDFRSEQGLYNAKKQYGYSPEELISHSFYSTNKEQFFDYYKANLVYKNAEPNSAHKVLAKWEKEGKIKAIITQNIDGLHQKAGSKNVLELHGSVLRNYCTKCHAFYDLSYILDEENCLIAHNHNTGVPICNKCGGVIKPDVVLYEEGLDNNILEKSVEAISNSDTLIVGGTSLVVYPAAGLLRYFKGDNLILINKSATVYDNKADLVISDSIGKVLQLADF